MCCRPVRLSQRECEVQSSGNLFSELKGRWREAEKPAIETASGKRYRFCDVDSGSARLANVLAALGVKPGDRVAVQADKSPEALILYLACLRAGAAYLPLNTAYTRAELDYFLKDAGPALFVCRPQDEAAAAALCAG